MNLFFSGFEKAASTRISREITKKLYAPKGVGRKVKDWANNPETAKVYKNLKRMLSDPDRVKGRRKMLEGIIRN